MTKGIDEGIEEGVFKWFDYGERDKIVKRVYIGEYACSRLVDRPQKRWTDTVKRKEVWMSGKQGE